MPGEGATGGDSMALLEARAQLVVEEKKASATGMYYYCCFHLLISYKKCELMNGNDFSTAVFMILTKQGHLFNSK